MSGFEEDTSDFTRRKEEKRESVNQALGDGDWRRRLERLLTGYNEEKEERHRQKNGTGPQRRPRPDQPNRPGFRRDEKLATTMKGELH